MTSDTTIKPSDIIDNTIDCDQCQACCCQLEVLLIEEHQVPEHFIAINHWGAESMAQLDDGWCAALDRDTMRCRIYSVRPSVCRIFEMGSNECIEERAEFATRQAKLFF